MRNIALVSAITFLISACTSSPQTVAHPTPSNAQIQMHEKLSDAHRKMADCLKLGRAEDACASEIMKDFPEPVVARHCEVEQSKADSHCDDAHEEFLEKMKHRADEE